MNLITTNKVLPRTLSCHKWHKTSSKQIFFQSLLGEVLNRKLKAWHSSHFLKATLWLPSECYVVALRRRVNLWAFPTHILGSIHWKTKVTLAWASHSSRMHETDFKRTYFKIFMFLLRAWGEITNIYNNPWQQETWLTTTQFRLNPWSANELQLWAGGGGGVKM